MFLLFFLLWIVFNGKITVEIAVIGLIVSGLMYAFICKFMDYSVKLDLQLVKSSPLMIYYLFILIKEIIKANFATIKMITTSKYEIEPVLITVKTNLKTKLAKVILADSITLTPGTITVSMEGDELIVHCLDKDFSSGIEDSVFVRLLEKIEGRLG